jgi:hypothetical protein
MKHHTKGKYLTAIEDIHKSKEFHGTTWSRRYRISYAVILAMKELDMIHQTRYGYYQWIGNKWPTMTDINKIYDCIQRKNKRYANESIAIKDEQLTIEPILKAPIDIQQPIVKEPECDTSNSKMILILAAGALVGFMIATIIWK